MRKAKAIENAKLAAKRLGEPFMVRSNRDETWWWFERISWIRLHTNLVPLHHFKLVVRPDGTEEWLCGDGGTR